MYQINLEVFYQYNKSSDFYEDTMIFTKLNTRSPVLEVVVKDFESLLSKAKSNGLLGLKFPVEWSKKQ